MEYLVISATSTNKPTAVVRELASLAHKHQCNIENSRLMIMGNEVAIMMMISGNWSTITKVEAGIPMLEKELNMVSQVKRTKLQPSALELIPYAVQIIGIEQLGIIYEISNFFNNLDVVILDLQNNTFSANLTSTRMFSLSMRIGVPPSLNIADFREHFAVLCDELNLDGLMEPEKY